MKTWDQFYRDVLPHVPGCPEPMADHALLRTAQQFFTTTRVNQVTFDPITIRPNLTSYDMPLPPKVEIVRLEHALLNGREIAITTAESMPLDWRTTQQGIEDCVFTEDRRSVTVLPLRPSMDPGSYILILLASMRPSDKADGIDDKFFALYSEIIAGGALARLMAQPKKSYTDQGEAQILRDKFVNAMSVTSIKRWRGFSKQMPRAPFKTY
jgi:hypothetical protein